MRVGESLSVSLLSVSELTFVLSTFLKISKLCSFFYNIPIKWVALSQEELEGHNEIPWVGRQLIS